MEPKIVHSFDDETSTGLDVVPLYGIIHINDYNSTGIKVVTLTDRTNITSATTVSTLIGTYTSQYEEWGGGIDWTVSQSPIVIHADNYTNTTYVASDFNHDDLSNISANDHIDWTIDQGATNIHAGNYTNTTYDNTDFVDLTSAQTVGGDKTYSDNIILNNDKRIQGKETGGTVRNLLRMNTSDEVQVGNATNDMLINSPNALIEHLRAPINLNAQTGNYTAVISDAEKMITINNASARTFTIPSNTSVGFDVGTKLNIMQLGAGQITVAINVDTLSKDSALTSKLNGQYAVATAVKIATTQWVLFGNLEPA